MDVWDWTYIKEVDSASRGSEIEASTSKEFVQVPSLSSTNNIKLILTNIIELNILNRHNKISNMKYSCFMKT